MLEDVRSLIIYDVLVLIKLLFGVSLKEYGSIALRMRLVSRSYRQTYRVVAMGGPGVSYAGDEDETRAVRESMMTLG